MRPHLTSVLCVLLTCFAATTFGQIRSGTIVGKVSDSSGASVTGVQVTVREINTNATFTVETNETGEYLAPYLQFGNYEVTAKKSGFKAVSQTGIGLSTAQTARVDIVLEVGAVETSVTVMASVVDLQT